MSDRKQLEMARARELATTGIITKDKELLKRHLIAGERWYGRGSKERILTYIKALLKGELE